MKIKQLFKQSAVIFLTLGISQSLSADELTFHNHSNEKIEIIIDTRNDLLSKTFRNKRSIKKGKKLDFGTPDRIIQVVKIMGKRDKTYFVKPIYTPKKFNKNTVTVDKKMIGTHIIIHYPTKPVQLPQITVPNGKKDFFHWIK